MTILYGKINFFLLSFSNNKTMLDSYKILAKHDEKKIKRKKERKNEKIKIKNRFKINKLVCTLL